MSVNRGKQFEEVVREAFEKVDGVSIDRLHDQTNGFAGSTNICDFIVYKKPFEYYIECKSVHGNTLSIHGTDEKHKYGNITNKQWEGLLEKSQIQGVRAGVICWWIDKDVTLFIPIKTLNIWRTQTSVKSVRFDIYQKDFDVVVIHGTKKRVFFDYDMEDFLRRLADEV